MTLTLYQIDAFTEKLFGGNPAAVVPLKKWLDPVLLQNIALENNLSETVFYTPSEMKGIDYDIRWFTPAAEVNLCGHATLAASYVIFNITREKKKTIRFNCKSGVLKITRQKNLICMDFPSWKPERLEETPAGLSAALGGVTITGVYAQRDLLVELESEKDVQRCQPDFAALQSIRDKVIITAAGKDCDFVSRFFAPGVGINEDPVTGSAHSQLVPFWSEKLGKPVLEAKQLSARGGTISCEQLSQERVLLKGTCVFYMKGSLKI